jgi:membrane protease YdiL (CAAX protease family)
MLGVFTLVAVGILFLEYKKKIQRFSDSILISLKIFGLIICVIIIPVLFSNYKSGINIAYEQIINSLIGANLFGVIFEEFLFRGLLWGFLKDQDLPESRIVLFQAILFWLAHYHSLFDGRLSFWVSIPFVSIILGILILRSKSLTISTGTHFLYNFLVSIFVIPV